MKISAFRSISLLALASSALAAQAAELNLNYTTSGTFSQSGSNVNKALSFTGGTFSTATVFNLLTLNFGTLSVAGGNTVPADAYSGTFNLNVLFTAPTGISPTSSPNFTANLTGFISTDSFGALIISFTGGTQNFTFSNPTGSGAFSFGLNTTSFNLDLTNAPTSKIVDGQGFGTFAPTPPMVGAPGPMAALPFALMALKRRRKA